MARNSFIRVNSDVAISIILKELSADETDTEMVSCAGGKVLAGISYAAHEAYVHDVRDFLANSGFKVDHENEIPYFSDFRGPSGSPSHE